MRVIRRKEAERKTGYTYKHLLNLEKAGKFPQRVQLGPNAVGWYEDEIDEWLAQRPRALDAREVA